MKFSKQNRSQSDFIVKIIGYKVTKMIGPDNFAKRPKMNIKIFDIGGNPNLWSNVCNSDIVSNPWNGYALAYKEAGLSYARKIKDDGALYSTFGYPIFFLFRHYVELRLKEILLSSMILSDEIPSHRKIDGIFTCTIWDEEMKSHNILELWKKCLIRFKKSEHWENYDDLGPDGSKIYRTIEYCINELSKYDGNSEAFRYPVASDGRILLNDTGVQTLNVHKLNEMMTWLSDNLESISVGIDEERKQILDDRAEHFRDFDDDYQDD